MRLYRMLSLCWLACACVAEESGGDAGSSDAGLALDGGSGADGILDAGRGFDGGGAPDASVGPDGGAPADAGMPGGSVDAGVFSLLGVYVVELDGGALRQLLDPGLRGLTHVRALAGTDWLTATRYTADLDGNGVAMELENGNAFYGGTEVVVFQQSQPTVISTVAGGVAGKICANSSWTEDGKLIFIQQDHPTDPVATRMKRATFSTLPNVTSLEVLATPPELLIPVDPHQVGPSDGGGVVVFSATFHHPTGFMRPVWRMSSAGANALSDVSVVGCPICPSNGGCCAFATVDEVLGTNDPRLNHAGTEVSWMQQSPQVFVNLPPVVHPYRQARKVGSMPQADLSTPGIASTTSETFIEWRADDQQGVYWAIEVSGATLRQNLYVMKPDGTDRRQVPLPRELCASHPSYLSPTQVIFSAFRCAGPSCTCDPAAL